ncbi:MAG TPA: carboxypeptidase-like regulatory domain-containing protein [Pseudonocardiaceae bacterium]|nr:carboxypeptidase-like regulatory domain-containing protein [Pseudonocardiaceae bacterium]
MLRRFLVLSAAVLAVGALAVPVATAATLPPSTPCVTGPAGGVFQSPLQVCASFDKASYKSSEPITATITITNLGQADDPGVWLPVGFIGTSLTILSGQFTGAGDGINDPNTGIDIPSGATVTAQAVGFANDADSGFVEFADAVDHVIGSDAPDQPVFTIVAPVTAVSGNFLGKVVTSAGDPLPGVGVTLFSDINFTELQATTDSNGVFTFKNQPGGPYDLFFAAPSGWLLDDTTIDIAAPGVPNHGRFVATRPESTFLSASMSFDQPSYAVGDTAGITVTLDNSNGATLTGVGAICDLSGDPGQLTGIGPGWAPFDSPGGATVPPGESTFQVSETVPANSAGPGTVEARCFFGASGNPVSEPEADVTAPVTG